MSSLIRLIKVTYVGVGMRTLKRVGWYQPLRSIANREFQHKRNSLMVKDKLPSGYELIYHAPMETYISITKNVTTLSAAIISVAAMYTASSTKFVPTSNFEMMGLVSSENDIWYFTSGFILITLIIHVFIAKYPLRIYRRGNDYIAIYDSKLLFRTSKHYFQKGDVRKSNNVFNPWNDCTYKLGEKSSIILENYFRTPSEYNKLLGYD